jgi:Ca-activated chloride channel family protein
MGWAYGGEGYEYETPGSVARGLLAELTARLDGDDRCAIVTYGTDVAVPLPPVAGDHPAVADAVAGLSSGGATNMEAGLQRAFAIAAEEQAAGTEAVRVFLFTDVQPNVGVTSPGSFRELAGTAAETGVGLTLFGLGVGLGQEVLAAITDLRGGNAFSLFATEDAGDLLADSWPWLACPLAHGLDLQLTVPAGLEVVGSYGFPGDEPGFSVASVFLSRRRGALLVELRPTGAAFPGGAEVSGVLEYVDLAGEPVREELAWTLQTPDEATDRWFEQPVVGRTVALAMLVDGMRNAAALYGVEREAAIAHLEAVAARIASDVDGLPAPELAAERDLAAALLALMREGAEQGDLYPGG